MTTLYEPAWNGEPPPANHCRDCRRFVRTNDGYGLCGVLADAVVVTLGLSDEPLLDAQVEVAEDFGCRHFEVRQVV